MTRDFENGETPEDDLALDPEFIGTSKWRSMSLDTLREYDDTRRAKNAGKYRQPSTMSNEGIALSSPAPLYKHLNRGSSGGGTLTKNWDDAHTKPRIWIKRIVNRPSYNLEISDIKGARPNPKNMKLGKAARNTCPLTPDYVLPSYKEPPSLEPKFLRDSLKLDDIEGCRPMALISSRERDHLSVRDIDGSYPGWKPLYKRNFGKNARDLCLNVDDIAPYQYRYVRDTRSEAYQSVDGSWPRPLTRVRSRGTLGDTILRNDDIEGSTVDSALSRSKLNARKQKSENRNIVSTLREKAELVAVNLLKTKVLEQMRSKSAKEVVRAFREMDRESSGKLSVSEVENAFKNLDVRLNNAELKIFRTAFDSSMDGFLHYWHLVKHLVPMVPSKKDWQSSKVTSMALHGWTQLVDEPADLYLVRGQARDENIAPPAKLNDPREEQAQPVAETRQQEPSTALKESARNREASEEADKAEHSTMSTSKSSEGVDIKQSNLTGGSRDELKSRGRGTVLPIGGHFWPEEKALKGEPALPESAKYLSLFSDFHEPPNMSAFYRILDDSEKRWTTKVGGDLYTGEGNIVSSTSYSDGGNHWNPLPSPQKRTNTRPATATPAVRPSTSTGLPSRRPSTTNMSLGSKLAWGNLQQRQDQQQRDANFTTRSSARNMGRPQSVPVRGNHPDNLHNGGNSGGHGGGSGTNHRRVHSSGGSSRIRVPPRVQAQLSQMMEDISAVKALR